MYVKRHLSIYFCIKLSQFGTFAKVGRTGSCLITVTRGSPCSPPLDYLALRVPQECAHRPAVAGALGSPCGGPLFSEIVKACECQPAVRALMKSGSGQSRAVVRRFVEQCGEASSCSTPTRGKGQPTMFTKNEIGALHTVLPSSQDP